MQNMISDHKKDLAEFKKEAAEGKDPEIRAWAAQTVPTLEQHLQKAEQTDANLPK
jgi:putative membrane protein